MATESERKVTHIDSKHVEGCVMRTFSKLSCERFESNHKFDLQKREQLAGERFPEQIRNICKTIGYPEDDIGELCKNMEYIYLVVSDNKCIHVCYGMLTRCSYTSMLIAPKNHPLDFTRPGEEFYRLLSMWLETKPTYTLDIDLYSVNSIPQCTCDRIRNPSMYHGLKSFRKI